jgi:hypothetical protein
MFSQIIPKKWFIFIDKNFKKKNYFIYNKNVSA